MPLRPVVAVDATPLAGGTGAARWLKNLLAVLLSVDQATEYVSLQPGRVRSGLAWELRGMQQAAVAARASAVFTPRELIGRAAIPVVLHVFEPPAYRLRARRPRGLAGGKSRLKDRLLAAAFQGSLRRASAVTAGSQTTADWLRERCDVDATVVLPGIDPLFREPGTRSAAAGTFFLLLASADGRQNSELVLEAFARARPDGVRLTTVGSPDELRGQLRSTAARLGIAELLDARGWVTDDELLQLYRDALALIHPSRYEGYAGYPALEAMAAGTPVIALAAPGASEALAGAAVLVEREDVRELADAIAAVAADQSLRESVGAAGQERVRGLTWEAAAGTLAAVFHRVVGSR
jgi:glycosyltransferase involved in cell wall biosynthesis